MDNIFEFKLIKIINIKLNSLNKINYKLFKIN